MKGIKSKTAVLKNLKTTALSLSVPFFGAAGLVCLFIWYSFAYFNDAYKHPVSYPLIILGGMISFLCFAASVVFYVIVRKTNRSVKGIIIDALTAVVTLPIFFLMFAAIYEQLSLLIK